MQPPFNICPTNTDGLSVGRVEIVMREFAKKITGEGLLASLIFLCEESR